MQVSPINTNSNVFQGKREKNKTGGAGKAWASVLIPGLGQFLDGRNREGAVFMGGIAGLGILNSFITRDFYKEASKAGTDVEKFTSAYTKYLESNRAFGSYILGVAVSALWIINIVDAYRGNKSRILDTFKNDTSDKPKVTHKVKKTNTTEKVVKSNSPNKAYKDELSE